MQIDSLRYFYEVAILRSISKAAHNSHISQSALSQQLLKLEEKLGVKLLKRSNKGVELTSEGEVLLKYTKKILENLNHLTEEINRTNNKKSSLDIETSCIISNYLINKAIPDLLINFNDFSINITNSTHDNAYSNLLHNLCDIMITCEKINDLDLVSTHIGTDYYILVSTKNINLKNLYSYPLLILKNKLLSQNIIQDYFNNFKTTLQTNSFATINEYLSDSSMPLILFLPKFCVNNKLLNNELIVIENYNLTFKYNLYLNYRKNTPRELRLKINNIINKLKEIFN